MVFSRWSPAMDGWRKAYMDVFTSLLKRPCQLLITNFLLLPLPKFPRIRYLRLVLLMPVLRRSRISMSAQAV